MTATRFRPVLPEYESAADLLWHRAVREFMRAQNPVLDSIRHEEVSQLTGATTPEDVAEGFTQAAVPYEFRLTLNTDATLTLDVEAWLASAWSAASDAVHALMPKLYAAMDESTERSGNVISAKGESFSWDHVIDTLERVDLIFDDEGRLKGHALVAHPTMVEQMRATPITVEQQARMDEVLKSKRETFHAKRRHRKLD